MVDFPIFVSIVCVLRNQSNVQKEIARELSDAVSDIVSDYEIIIVDNGSTDNSVSEIKQMAGENGLPNLQVYALTKEVDSDISVWVGLENALGDFVVVIEPLTDDINFLPKMLEKSMLGSDVVFAVNKLKPRQGFLYAMASRVFYALYKQFNGIDLVNEAPQYRVLSKRVVNFILQHQQPALTYRHLPASGGFAKSVLSYSSRPRGGRQSVWVKVLIGVLG